MFIIIIIYYLQDRSAFFFFCVNTEPHMLLTEHVELHP